MCANTLTGIPADSQVPQKKIYYNAAQFLSAGFCSNGNLDPWSGGGVTSPIPGADSIVPIYIMNAAHHYDLRGFDLQDTPEILIARAQEIKIICGWLKSIN